MGRDCRSLRGTLESRWGTGVLDTGEFHHDGGVSEEGGQKAEEGGGDRAGSDASS